MTRFKLILEYDGRPFVGWQRQYERYSVQQVLEEAVFQFCGEVICIYGAGRTDSGVHATGQAAHFDLRFFRPPSVVRDALNFYLRPWPIAVLEAAVMPENFDARFSAISRSYLYRILNRQAPPALDHGRVWHVNQKLSATAMQEAAAVLIGRHDFTSFRSRACQAKSPVRTLDRLDVTAFGDEIWIKAEARSFLHHQVRNIVGTLCRIGKGKWASQDLKRILAAHDRTAAGPTAPAEGLYLTAVRYPG